MCASVSGLLAVVSGMSADFLVPKKQPVDIHVHIIPAFHHSFNV